VDCQYGFRCKIEESENRFKFFIGWRDQDLNKGYIPRQNDRRDDIDDKHDTKQSIILMAFTIHCGAILHVTSITAEEQALLQHESGKTKIVL
jgi:hypothetical protein